MPGQLPKPADERQRTNGPGLDLSKVSGNLTLKNAPPKRGWGRVLTRSWKQYWSGPLAGTVGESDLPGLYRIWDMRKAISDMDAAIERDGLVDEEGNVHGLVTKRTALLAPLLVLEKEYGLTPAAKARLGIQGAKAHKTIRDSMIADRPIEVDPRG